MKSLLILLITTASLFSVPFPVHGQYVHFIGGQQNADCEGHGSFHVDVAAPPNFTWRVVVFRNLVSTGDTITGSTAESFTQSCLPGSIQCKFTYFDSNNMEIVSLIDVLPMPIVSVCNFTVGCSEGYAYVETSAGEVAWYENGVLKDTSETYLLEETANILAYDIWSGSGIPIFDQTVQDTCGVSTFVGENPVVPVSASVCPNPARDRVTISAEGMTEYVISDISGRIVLAASAVGTDRVDLSSFRAGVYNVTIATKTGPAFARFVVE